MQKTVCAVAAAVCLVSAGVAYAAPMKPTSDTYNLTLTAGAAPSGDKAYQGGGGTGSITITASGTPDGIYTDYGFPFGNGGLMALSFTLNDNINGVDPLVFDLNNTNLLPDPSVTFSNGSLSGISYQSTDFSGIYILNFDTSDMSYTLSDSKLFGADRVIDQGTIGVNAPASVTPEPSSLMLLGTGLLAGCGVVRRRLA